jgi:hypothetical protein
MKWHGRWYDKMAGLAVRVPPILWPITIWPLFMAGLVVACAQLLLTPPRRWL